MGYDPNIHNRRSIRLKGYDYSQAGAYFITLNLLDRKCLFGSIHNGEMILNSFGLIAHEQWIRLPERFLNFQLDIFQIMPDHMHGIIILSEPVGAGLAPAQAGVKPAPTIGDIIGAYKSLVANECLAKFKLTRPNERMGKLWQRNYYERIIRDERAYNNISEYIINNPKNSSGHG